MAFKKIDTGDWKAVDWLDLNPLPGSFVSSQPAREFNVHGETVIALNWLHAEYLLLKRKVAEAGGEWGKCAHCGANIRYAVVFENEAGQTFLAGRDCGKFIGSKLPREKYEEMELIASMKQIKTKNGERVVLSFKAPGWLWSIPKTERPKFISLSPYEKPGRGYQEKIWYVTIWGADANETLNNYAEFKALAR